MSNEKELPRRVECPACQGQGRVQTWCAGGWNVTGWADCEECFGGEIEIEETEDVEWYRKKAQKYGVKPEI